MHRLSAILFFISVTNCSDNFITVQARAKMQDYNPQKKKEFINAMLRNLAEKLQETPAPSVSEVREGISVTIDMPDIVLPQTTLPAEHATPLMEKVLSEYQDDDGDYVFNLKYPEYPTHGIYSIPKSELEKYLKTSGKTKDKLTLLDMFEMRKTLIEHDVANMCLKRTMVEDMIVDLVKSSPIYPEYIEEAKKREYLPIMIHTDVQDRYYCTIIYITEEIALHLSQRGFADIFDIGLTKAEKEYVCQMLLKVEGIYIYDTWYISASRSFCGNKITQGDISLTGVRPEIIAIMESVTRKTSL